MNCRPESQRLYVAGFVNSRFGTWFMDHCIKPSKMIHGREPLSGEEECLGRGKKNASTTLCRKLAQTNSSLSLSLSPPLSPSLSAAHCGRRAHPTPHLRKDDQFTADQHSGLGASVVMPRLSYPTETVLSSKMARNRIVLSFKDSPPQPLRRRPSDGWDLLRRDARH